MVSNDRVRRALLFFVSGKAASGVLGVLWLAALVRVCNQQALGVYLAFLSLFEITQLLSSCGLYSFVQRYLPQGYAALEQSTFSRTLTLLLLARGASLCAVGYIIFFLWDQISAWQGWPSGFLSPWVAVGFIILEGQLRFLDSIFESMVYQGYSQVVSVVRNVLRLIWLLVLTGNSTSVQVEAVLKMELILAGIFLLVGLVTLRKLVNAAAPKDVAVGLPQLQKAVSFSLNTYAALAVGQVCSVDAMRLVVGHFCGTNVVAVYGLAQAIADVVRRYMPMQLFQGFVRSVIIAKLAQHGDHAEAESQAALLHKLNFFFLAIAAGMAAAAGDQALLLLSKKAGFDEVTPYLVGFLFLLSVQAVRMLFSMIATIKEDGKSILIATLVSCGGMLLAIFLIPIVGAWGGIFGLLVAESAYALTLRVRLLLNLRAIFGATRGYFVIVLAASVAAVFAHNLSVSVNPMVQLMFSSVTYLVTLHILVARGHAFSSEESERINRVLPIKVFVW